jgi:hypothetical protein
MPRKLITFDNLNLNNFYMQTNIFIKCKSSNKGSHARRLITAGEHFMTVLIPASSDVG